MNNFKILYRILKILEKAMDLEEFDPSIISAEALGISVPRWSHLMETLSNEDYIKGVNISRSMDGLIQVSMCNVRITLKGLEYLNESSLMKKAANLAKGISDLIP